MFFNKTKPVSVIILSHNRKKDVLECLDSVKNLTYPNYDIILVDNGSSDGSFEALAKEAREHKNIKLVETGKNLGTAAINEGIRNSTGEYVLILADDVIIHKDALTELVNVMENDDQIGIAGSLTYFYDKPNEVWFYPMEFSDIKNKVACVDVITAVGCAFMIKKAVIDRIGLFDEDYFIYHEEADYCHRARKRGFRVVCALKSSVWHKVPLQDPYRELSHFRAYYFYRNFFLFAKKNFETIRGRLNFLFQSYIYYPPKGRPFLWHFPWIVLLKCLRSRKIDLLTAYFKGFVDGAVWFFAN